MKTKLVAGLMLLNIFMLGHSKHMDLKKALDLKLVKTTVKSVGGFQGYCIQMSISNLYKDSLIITLEAGRRLNSLNEKEQDILITKSQIIALNSRENKTILVKGYCCEATNNAPQAGSFYDINKMANDSLVQLARYLDTCHWEADVEQQAVWAISNNKPVSCVASFNDSNSVGIRVMVAQIKGEKIPWYTVITKTFVYRSGNFQTYAIRLKGQLEYNNDKERYTTLHVLDQWGNEVCSINGQWTHPGVGQKFDLNLPLKGLEKGQYTVELKSADNILAQKEFEI